jgi:26S proteasome regulatory subunit N5
MKRRGQAKKA